MYTILFFPSKDQGSFTKDMRKNVKPVVLTNCLKLSYDKSKKN